MRRQSAVFYLHAAMRAIGGDGDSILTNAVHPADLPAVRLEDYRMIVLSEVDELPLPQVERLERFVEAGGRADRWRFTAELPERLRLLDRAAGLDHRELTARSLYLPGGTD